MSMRSNRRSTIVLCVFLLCLFHAGLASAFDPARVVEQLEDIRARALAPGVSAAIAVDGEVVFSGGVGLGDVENDLSLTGRSVHNIASISKTHAAIAVMQLVERGRVDLDADIQTYVPWFPRKQAPISVRQILTHTSGIRHYQDGEFGEGDVLRFRQFDDIETASQRWADDPLLFDPGSAWRYSSYATNLLQALVENVSGQGFEAYLAEHVWGPSGLQDTQFDVPARIVPRRTHAYRVDAQTGALSHPPQENVSYKYAGGGILSTNEDGLRFGHALNTGKLLGDAAMTAMYALQLPEGMENAEQQALIWRVGTDGAGRPFVGHSGSVKGALSYLLLFPEHDVVVSLYVNATGGQVQLQQDALRLAQTVLPIPVVGDGS